jgi:hypothetical protein
VLPCEGSWRAGRRHSLPQIDIKRAIMRARYDAVLFDGVITDTVSIHVTCWKQMFDEYISSEDGHSP